MPYPALDKARPTKSQIFGPSSTTRMRCGVSTMCCRSVGGRRHLPMSEDLPVSAVRVNAAALVDRDILVIPGAVYCPADHQISPSGRGRRRRRRDEVVWM